MILSRCLAERNRPPHSSRHRAAQCLATATILAGAALTLPLAAISAENAPAPTEQIAGELMVPVTLVVVDAQTDQPLGKAEVTFLTAGEAEILDAVASGKRPAPADKRELPSGLSAYSEKNGEVRMTCEFAATFFESQQGGETRVTRTRIQPAGRFVVKKAGYGTLTLPANELFASIDGGAAEIGRTITLRLHKAAEKT